LDIFNF
jgi:hypothetical protein